MAAIKVILLSKPNSKQKDFKAKTGMKQIRLRRATLQLNYKILSTAIKESSTNKCTMRQ